MSKINLSEASPEENQKLIDFCKAQLMPGKVQVSLERSPNFFTAMKVEGRNSKVFTAKINEEIIGVGSVCEKQCYLDGKKNVLGYLGNLRITPRYRTGTLLPRAYRYLRGLHGKEFESQLYLTTIMSDNTHALKILTSGRAGLPPYIDWGELNSYIYHSDQRPWKKSTAYKVLRATKGDTSALIAFLEKEGPNKQFYPVYREDDLNKDSGLLNGLKSEDFYLCWDGDRIIGAIGLWDQGPFRRWKIQSYSKSFSFIRPLINIAGKMLSYPRYPVAGNPISYFYLSCWAIKNNDSEITEHILATIFEELNHDRNILVTIHERDSLNSVFSKGRHIILKSRLFLVYWDEAGEKILQELSRDKVPYIETGSI